MAVSTSWLPSKSSWSCMFSGSGCLRGLAPALLVHVMLLGQPQVTLDSGLSACSPGPPLSHVLSMGFTSAPCGSLPPSECLLLCFGVFPGGSVVKICLQCRSCKRCRIDLWVGKIPGGGHGNPTPVFLPGESHGQRSLAG